LGFLSIRPIFPNYAETSAIVRETVMLDFMVVSPKRFLNEFVALAEPGKTARAAADRRSAAPAAPASGLARKRRRHDNLGCGRPAPLAW
jgi:hypothetical protein